MATDKVDHYHLKQNEHWKNVSSTFKRMQNGSKLVDVTLSCEGKRIPAHKILLSACSPYFEEVFQENPCKHPVIIFRNVAFSDLKAIVEFVYTGEVNVSRKDLPSFLNTAELLQIQGLIHGSSKSSTKVNDAPKAPAISDVASGSSDKSGEVNYVHPGFEQALCEQGSNDNVGDEDMESERMMDPLQVDTSTRTGKSTWRANGNNPTPNAVNFNFPEFSAPLVIKEELPDPEEEQSWMLRNVTFPTLQLGGVKKEIATEKQPLLRLTPCDNLCKPQLLKLMSMKKRFRSRVKLEQRIQPDRKNKVVNYKLVENSLNGVARYAKPRMHLAYKAKMENDRKYAASVKKQKQADNLFKCGVCSLSFETAKLLKGHKEEHKRDRLYECPVCQKLFGSSPSMQKHMLVQHHLLPSLKERKSTSCYKCGLHFSTVAVLKNHLYVHHYDTLVCTVCRRIFLTKSRTKDHIIKEHILEQQQE